jgi:hypothetical protein|nr:hypothetical protein [Kofleriaceae bacterium]
MTLAAPIERVDGTLRIRAERPVAGDGMLITTTISDVTQADGERAATGLVNATYEHALINLATYIESSSPPNLQSAAFEPVTPSSVATGTALGTSTGSAPGCACLAPTFVEPTLAMALQYRAPRQAAPHAIAARRMFRIAMETTDAVASYLVCYSALALGARVAGLGGDQKAVDALLRGTEPSIKLRRTSRGGKDRDESEYTRIRNEFVHAESTGAPERAATEMHAHLQVFRALSGRAIANL